MPSTRPIPCPTEEPLERSRFFAGQLLGADDFTAEQDYHLAKQRLHNRYLHGYGTVCGLAVEASRPASAIVVVQPGLAIDCCGREILVVQPVSFDPTAWLGEQTPVRRAYVTLGYGEVEVDQTPALVGADGAEDTFEASRVREIAVVGVSTEPPTDGVEVATRNHIRRCPPCTEVGLILAAIDLSSPDHITNTHIDNTVRRMSERPPSNPSPIKSNDCSGGSRHSRPRWRGRSGWACALGRPPGGGRLDDGGRP